LHLRINRILLVFSLEYTVSQVVEAMDDGEALIASMCIEWNVDEIEELMG
jgi:hypothetical protein